MRCRSTAGPCACISSTTAGRSMPRTDERRPSARLHRPRPAFGSCCGSRAQTSSSTKASARRSARLGSRGQLAKIGLLDAIRPCRDRYRYTIGVPFPHICWRPIIRRSACTMRDQEKRTKGGVSIRFPPPRGMSPTRSLSAPSPAGEIAEGREPSHHHRRHRGRRADPLRIPRRAAKQASMARTRQKWPRARGPGMK